MGTSTARLELRLPAAEKAEIEEAAGLTGRTVTEYVRTAARDAARTDLARRVRFPDTTTGEDTAFLKGCTEAGARIYSATRFGFVQRRSAAPTHTWDISGAEILSTATVSHWGPPNETEVPGS